jgi:hypothetical protein
MRASDRYFWYCNVCNAQNSRMDGECQHCECRGPECKRDNCSGACAANEESEKARALSFFANRETR